MIVRPTSLPGVQIIDLNVFPDARGYFFEFYRQQRYADHGFQVRFGQDNIAFSHHRVLRGLHLQNPNPQVKLVQVLMGSIFDVCVDVRKGSSTFAKWFGTDLSAEKPQQLLVPEGYAHGYCVTSNTAIVAYKCSGEYSPGSEMSVRWSDPSIGIVWPVTDPILSDKDAKAPLLKDIPENRLPELRRLSDEIARQLV